MASKTFSAQKLKKPLTHSLHICPAWRLIMIIRWPLLILKSLGQRSRSQRPWLKSLSAQLLKNALVNSLHIWYWGCLWLVDDPFWLLSDCVKGQGHMDFFTIISLSAQMLRTACPECIDFDIFTFEAFRIHN
jgi:hypothetical protein